MTGSARGGLSLRRALPPTVALRQSRACAAGPQARPGTAPDPPSIRSEVHVQVCECLRVGVGVCGLACLCACVRIEATL